MTSKEGGFFSAEDADSNLPGGGHAEGAFYVWDPGQVRAVVPGKEGDVLCRALGVVEGGNFSTPHPEEPQGMSVLHRVEEPDSAGMAKLFAARAKRPRPHLDDKILADWNGLMIGAMAFAGSVLGEERYVQAAERAARFLLSKMRRPDGRWWHRAKDGEVGIDAFLDDYACLAEGFFFLHQATFRTEYAEVAVRTAELMIEDFGDSAGGFFHTSKSAEKLIARMKESYDGALPSGNSVAALALLRLAHLMDRSDFRKKAEETLKFFAGTIARHPVAYPYHLCAVQAMSDPGQEIVLVGESVEMVRAIRRRYSPNAVVVVVPPAGPDEKLRKLIPMTQDRPQQEGRATAYVCRGGTCRLPVTDLESLERELEGK